MKIISIYSCLSLVIVSFFCLNLQGQDIYQLGENSAVKIQGTSTLHAWESVVEKTAVKMTANALENEIEINELILTVESRSIKSGKDVMDMKTYNALKSTEYPDIIFTLTAPLKTAYNSEITAKGLLLVAGIEKEIEVMGKVINTKGELQIKASHIINMPDYDIVPPTALFGTIETGEDITAVFDISLQKAVKVN